jgi:hypothetical protein
MPKTTKVKKKVTKTKAKVSKPKTKVAAKPKAAAKSSYKNFKNLYS